PEVFTLGLGGDGDVIDVLGSGLRDWAVRQSGGKRFLELRPTGNDVKDLNVTVRTLLKNPSVPGGTSVPVIVPVDSVGFSSQVKLDPDAAIDLRVIDVGGMMPFAETQGTAPLQFYATGEGKIHVTLAQRGVAQPDASLTSAELHGKLNEAGGCVDF